MRISAFRVVLALATVVIIAAIATNRWSQPACTALNGLRTLSVKLDGLAPGKVRSFCYRDRVGERLRFLLARDSSGKVHAVFDACQQCYKFHKGYTWSHGYLVCRLCGNRYPIKNVKVGEASCVPVPLASKLAGGKVTIKVADVMAGQWLF
ncbi:MAG: Fe-S-containing protein [Candidatus Binataceae bacterium]